MNLIENHASNNNDIENLLSNDIESGETAGMVATDEMAAPNIEIGATLEEKIDDDLSILIGQTGIPKPKEMRFKLVKREDDLFSGDIPFDMTVCIIYLSLGIR